MTDLCRADPEHVPARHHRPPVTTTVPAGPRDTFWPRLLPGLAALAVLTRLPSFLHPLWNPDEGFLATEARMLAHGAVLYRTVVDRKPPVLPWLYELSFALFGDRTLLPVKALAVLAQLLTAVLLASYARRRWGARAGRTAGVLQLLASVALAPDDAQAAAFEVFMVPGTVAAVWCADRGRWGAAGLAVAAAVLTKQTGAAVLAPVLLLLLRTAPRRVAAATALAGGVLLPVAAVALATGPARLLFWSVTGSAGYASAAGAVSLAVDRALSGTGIFATGCAGLLLPVCHLLVARRGAAPAELWLWLAASAAAVATGFHFFGHYYLQLTPPLVLLATAALAAPGSRLLTGTSLTLSALSCAFFLGWGLTDLPPDLPHTLTVVRAVRERTPPAGRVLLWGMHPETYWLADRPPAGRFLTAGLLTNYSGGRGPSHVGEAYGVPGAWPAFRRELARRPPALIVDDSRGKPYGPSRLPSLRAVLDRSYEQVGTADGAILYAPAAHAHMPSHGPTDVPRAAP
ncbi:glycosyltransferase family 39 protein [Streptomyces sp. UNOC14_S4]|uniref:glycosyltransferase family 39 protein n=1 Tax=Streptomyces sp. UNOC14_S4 TaxID=2872340 RepID=UPI001E4F91C0|nr:glycosyltransferase family 39 protein [Streptomyces sp. UNOC14_S4]MCC3768476.1 glycosyltransferase family 39 protein [Streptomyces sp. UNOC14_S4]